MLRGYKKTGRFFCLRKYDAGLVSLVDFYDKSANLPVRISLISGIRLPIRVGLSIRIHLAVLVCLTVRISLTFGTGLFSLAVFCGNIICCRRYFLHSTVKFLWFGHIVMVPGKHRTVVIIVRIAAASAIADHDTGNEN